MFTDFRLWDQLPVWTTLLKKTSSFDSLEQKFNFHHRLTDNCPISLKFTENRHFSLFPNCVGKNEVNHRKELEKLGQQCNVIITSL